MKNLLNIANPSKASKMIVTALNLSAEASAVSEKLKFINCVTGCEARNFGTNYDLDHNFVTCHTRGTYDRKPTVYLLQWYEHRHPEARQNWTMCILLVFRPE